MGVNFFCQNDGFRYSNFMFKSYVYMMRVETPYFIPHSGTYYISAIIYYILFTLWGGYLCEVKRITSQCEVIAYLFYSVNNIVT